MIDLHSIIQASPLFIAFVLSMQLFSAGKLKIELPPKVLLAYFINVVVFTIPVLHYRSENFQIIKFTDGFFYFGMLMFHTLIYLYIKAIVSDRIFSYKVVFHFLPAGTALLIGMITLLSMSNSDLQIYFKEVLYGAEPGKVSTLILSFLLKGTRIIHAFQAIVYFILILRLLKQHRKATEQVFAQIGKHRLNWFFIFNIVYSSASLLGMVANSIPTEVILNNEIYNNSVLLMISGFTLFIGIKGLNQESIGSTINKLDKETQQEGYKAFDLPYDFLIERINGYVLDKKAFLNPDLNIWHLVENTGINRTYISKAINSQYSSSFSQYINNLRVNQVCQSMTKYPEKSLEEIAFDCGFNSVSTFNRAVKKFKGTSPSLLRIKLMDNEDNM